MSNSAVEVEAESAIRAFAELKNVNVYTVLFNIAKDFVSEAYRATPVAKLGIKESPYALLTPRRLCRKPLRGGKERQYIRINAYPDQVERLDQYKAQMAQYWSQTSWIAAMRLLGFQRKGSSSSPMAAARYSSSFKKAHAKNNTLTMDNVVRARLERKRSDLESITLVDRIWFDKLPGTEQAIIAAGERKAAMNIAREWDRQLKRRWK